MFDKGAPESRSSAMPVPIQLVDYPSKYIIVEAVLDVCGCADDQGSVETTFKSG
jgi:hypothetical protein